MQNEWRTVWLASTLVPLGLFFLWDLAQLEDVDTYLPISLVNLINPNVDNGNLEASDGSGDNGVFELRLHNVWFLAIAAWLDAREWLFVARYVVCALPNSLPAVEVDTRPSANCVNVGAEKVGLIDVKEVHRFTKRWCQAMGAAHIAGVWPFALITLFLARQNATYAVSRAFSLFFGLLVWTRAFVGPDLFAKGALACDWLLASSVDGRNLIGEALTLPLSVTREWLRGDLRTTR